MAPNFTLPSQEDKPISLSDFKGKWVVLYFYPKDQTQGCTIEAHNFQRDQPKYDKLNAVVLGVSLDTVASHQAWCAKDTFSFKMLADPDHKVADLYGMIHPNANDTLTVRSVFIIGPDDKVKLTLTYPASTGRNFDELLRVIDSLQLTAKHKVSTPADWKQGENVIIGGGVSDDEANKIYPDGWDAPKPYLRIVPQPQ